jgi:mercuric ion binding protein
MAMKSSKSLLGSVLVTLVFSVTAWAALRTVTLKVPGMTCPACPITVRKALERVPGVTTVEVRYEKKQAVVTFDDGKTSTEALLKATKDAGYPSEVEKDSK